jgi:zinc transporter, ZIP family
VLEAGLWGLVAGSSLLLGAVAGLVLRLPRHMVAAITGFGAGVLVSAVAFELTEEAYAVGGADAVALGLGAGAIVYFAGDRYIEAMDTGSGEGTSKAIEFGAALDAVPESAAIGLSVLAAGSVSPALVGAVFLSNVPEALASTGRSMGMGHSSRRVILRWSAIVLLAGVSSALGYLVLDGASENLIAFTQAFAGGAVLCMLANTMFPEAYREYDMKPQVGLTTVFGFAVAFLLSSV